MPRPRHAAGYVLLRLTKKPDDLDRPAPHSRDITGCNVAAHVRGTRRQRDLPVCRRPQRRTRLAFGFSQRRNICGHDRHKKAKLYKQNLEWTAPTDYFIKLASDKGTATRQIINSVETWHMYGGKDEWLVNMGYSDEAQSSITLTFNQADAGSTRWAPSASPWHRSTTSFQSSRPPPLRTCGSARTRSPAR